MTASGHPRACCYYCSAPLNVLMVGPDGSQYCRCDACHAHLMGLVTRLEASLLQQRLEIDRLRALADLQFEEMNAYQCVRLTSPSERGDGVTPTSHTMPAG